METKNNKITVLGSTNRDTFIKVERAPEMGETISSSGLANASGGKGANQAACIAKLGYNIEFVSQIGEDDDGEVILEELKRYGVNTDYIYKHNSEPTGHAFIFSYPNADNSIVIVGGANTNWRDNDLIGLKNSLTHCKIFLNFSEIPLNSKRNTR
jgi:ribokinase